ncbi:uncharacterized protein [Mobula birostris]|uniref:uncharacterized protein isoform X2 n=1 Tax=Mobula birostris TaxID=1983395 RepID=UPI003B280013
MVEKFTVSYMTLLVITWLIVKVTANEVSQFPRDLNVPGGANVTMFCKFPLSQDTVDIRWRRQGEKAFLERDSRRQFTVERGRGTLVLRNVKFSDSGLYYCEVKFQEQFFVSSCGTSLTVFGADTKFILACALGGSAILALIIVLVKVKLKRLHGINTSSLDRCQSEELADQAAVDDTTPHVSLNMRESKGFRKDRQEEECIIYSQTAGNGADKLTYAALQIPDSKNTPASKQQNKHALYADVNTSKKL